MDAGWLSVVHYHRWHPGRYAVLQIRSTGFFPFGKEIIYGGGGVSFLANLIWILLFGWEMAVGYLILGLVWCVTIIGIPIGRQCFKMAKLSFMPFGAQVVG